MRRLRKKGYLVVTVSLVLLTLLALGCGSSTRNDQGVSFTFFGWFADIEGTAGAESVAMPIGGVNPETAGFENDVVLYAGLQNNLTGQFIRVERLFHTFYVPGSTISIPDTSVSVPGVISPSSLASSDSNSSLPAGASQFGENGGNVIFAGALLVPRSVREFISLNRNNFPEPPFVMIVTSYASGVTSAGKRMDSNEVEIEVVVEPEVIITPTEGSGGTSGLTGQEVFQ